MIRNIQGVYESSTLINNAKDNFSKGNYDRLIKNINKYISNFDAKNKCTLYKYLAKAFEMRYEYDFALLNAKYALLNMPTDAESAYLVAKYLLENNDRMYAQIAFFALSKLDKEHKYTQEIMERLVEEITKKGPQLVPYEEKRYRILSDAENLFESGDECNAIKKVENFYKKNQNDIVLLNFLALFLTKTNQYDSAKKYAQKMLEVENYGVNSLCTMAYVLVEENEDVDLSNILDKIIKVRALNVDDILKVSSLLSVNSRFSDIVDYIDKNNHIICYTSYLIKSIALYNLEKVKDAIDCISEAISIYGKFGFSEVYKKYYIECEYSPLLITDFDKLPLPINESSKYYISGKGDFKKYDSQIFFKIDIENHQENIIKYIANNKKYFGTLSNEFLLDFVSNSYKLNMKTKAEILFYLMQERGLRNIKVFSDTGIIDVEIDDFKELHLAPKVLEYAYYIVVAYCIYSNTKFLQFIKFSFIKLYNILSNCEHTFTNSHLLAGAIMCDMALFIGDDIVSEVSNFMGLSTRSLNRYLKEIRAYGAYADFDQDEAFSRHIATMMENFGEMDKI